MIEHMFVSDVLTAERSTAELREAVQAMSADARGLTSIQELSAWLQQLEQLNRTVEAAMLDVLAHTRRCGAYTADGHVSVSSWARATVRWSEAEIKSRVSSSRLVEAFPQVGDELAEGRVGVTQVRDLARAHDNDRCGDQLGDVVDHLLAEAQRFDHRDFRLLVRRWTVLADADGAHRHHDDINAARDAFVTVLGDEGLVTASLGTTQLATVQEVFDQYVELEFDADVASVPAGAPLPRTASQRRADAFVAVFQAAAASPGAAAGIVPIVDILIDQTTYEAQLEAMLTGDPVDLRPDQLAGRRCETRRGVPIDPGDAVVASVVGEVRRVVIGSDSVVTDLGRRSRVFTGHARTAVHLLRLVCEWLGCIATGNQTDHLTTWSENGHTNPCNGGPACGRHNRLRNFGFRVERDADGHFHVYRPDGSEIITI